MGACRFWMAGSTSSSRSVRSVGFSSTARSCNDWTSQSQRTPTSRALIIQFTHLHELEDDLEALVHHQRVVRLGALISISLVLLHPQLFVLLGLGRRRGHGRHGRSLSQLLLQPLLLGLGFKLVTLLRELQLCGDINLLITLVSILELITKPTLSWSISRLSCCARTKSLEAMASSWSFFNSFSCTFNYWMKWFHYSVISCFTGREPHLCDLDLLLAVGLLHGGPLGLARAPRSGVRRHGNVVVLVALHLEEK